MENTGETIGPMGLIKKHDLIRIITQCLRSLGYVQSANCLESESCISCTSPEFKSLELQVRNAKWDDCIESLNRLKGLRDETRVSALLLVYEQYLLECVNNQGATVALDVLQKKVARSTIGKENVMKLSYKFLFTEEFERSCIDHDVVQDLRKKLISRLEGVLPPPISLPDRRLEILIERAVCHQIEHCDYHVFSDVISLYRDHDCCQDEFPTETIQILTDHYDEVWFVQFSNNGEYLASSSSDCSGIIWKIHDDSKVTLKYKLNGHKRPISFLTWSPDDTMLLTCGNNELVNLWDVETGTLRRTFGNSSFIISSCSWFPDSKSLLCGSSEPQKGICHWDCDGNEIRAWRGMRMPSILDLAVTPDGKNLISVFSDKEIRIWNLSASASKERVISEDHSITSLSVSGDGKFLIVNLNNEKIHMWDVAGTLLQPFEYVGHKQQKYVIRSCFGGSNCRFIASGSEDSKVYIWKSQCSYPLEILSGHEKTVNCVTWNPKRHQMLASGSDDCKIRIWGPSRLTR